MDDFLPFAFFMVLLFLHNKKMFSLDTQQLKNGNHEEGNGNSDCVYHNLKVKPQWFCFMESLHSTAILKKIEKKIPTQ
jgi:hypothetical protein